jgi:hypothetical protein
MAGEKRPVPCLRTRSLVPLQMVICSFHRAVRFGRVIPNNCCYYLLPSISVLFSYKKFAPLTKASPSTSSTSHKQPLHYSPQGRSLSSFNLIPMSSMSDFGQPDEAQLLPAYEALPREKRGLSPDARRLFWSFNRPLITSLWIMETRKMPESRKPYFRQTTGGDATTSPHPASQSPLTEPKVSSVTVSVDELEKWDED